MELRIVAMTGKARGQAVQIRSPKFFIGSHENCQLRPDIKHLDGIHALIEQRDMRVFLNDFGAAGGTGVNDRILHAREIEVFDGDLIQIGPMVLTLVVKTKPEEGTPAVQMYAPDGWPFLEDTEDEDRPLPSIPVETETRVEREPRFASRIETAVATASVISPVAVAALEAAVATAPPPPRPSTPLAIPGRPTGRKAVATSMVDDVMVATVLTPDLNDEDTVSPFRHELRSIMEEEPPAKMVVDLGNTRYLSSRAVGVLLAHYQVLDRNGAEMRVCGVGPGVRPVLDQMRLSMLVDIFPSVDEAVQTPWE
jgi:anti-anti-sigma factor